MSEYLEFFLPMFYDWVSSIITTLLYSYVFRSLLGVILITAIISIILRIFLR